jgi:hypothetical protein
MKSTLKPPVSQWNCSQFTGRRAADEQQLVLVEVEQDAVADDVAFVAGRHHLLARFTGKFAKLLIVV